MPVLAPDREQLLEYDIMRAIARVASASKPVIGVMSALPVLGRPLNPMTKQQPTEPWVLATELQNDFTVKKVEMTVDRITRRHQGAAGDPPARHLRRPPNTRSTSSCCAAAS